jgi:hemolysin activation/secretion protein
LLTFFFSDSKPVRRNTDDKEEENPIPRSGRQIRSAEEIQRIMKSVEQFAGRPLLQQQQQQQRSLQLDGNHKQKGQLQQAPVTRVQIHNIRSSLPRPEIEMIYTVYQGRQIEITQFTALVHRTLMDYFLF